MITIKLSETVLSDGSKAPVVFLTLEDDGETYLIPCVSDKDARAFVAKIEAAFKDHTNEEIGVY